MYVIVPKYVLVFLPLHFHYIIIYIKTKFRIRYLVLSQEIYSSRAAVIYLLRSKSFHIRTYVYIISILYITELVVLLVPCRFNIKIILFPMIFSFLPMFKSKYMMLVSFISRPQFLSLQSAS